MGRTDALGRAVRFDRGNEPAPAGQSDHDRQHDSKSDRHQPESDPGHRRIADRRVSESQQHDRFGELLWRGLLGRAHRKMQNGAPEARRSRFSDPQAQRTNSRIA